jgi:hypothetical protein
MFSCFELVLKGAYSGILLSAECNVQLWGTFAFQMPAGVRPAIFIPAVDPMKFAGDVAHRTVSYAARTAGEGAAWIANVI